MDGSLANDFLARAYAAFDIGTSASAKALGGASANRTWRIDARRETFFLKEFRYPPTDVRWVDSLRAAVEFEAAIWRSGAIDMPEPVAGTSGEFLETVTGSHGVDALVRLHRWTPGQSSLPQAAVTMARAAGAQLGAVQSIGADHRRARSGSLLWWNWEPRETLARFGAGGFLTAVELARYASVIDEAIALAEVGQRTDCWTFCHRDHKPDNVLLHDDRLILTDWDEAALCPPRYEVTEAALLWSGWDGRIASRERMVAFLDGYRSGGAAIDRPEPLDFAKWAAERVGWFNYLALRALGLVSSSDAEAGEARKGAIATLRETAAGLPQLERWAAWMT